MTDALTVGSVLRREVAAEVVDEADVVVAGGGTAGCVAAIAAARNGADVLLIERSGTLGGMMTTGNAGLTKYIVHEKSQADYRGVLADLATDPSAVQVVGGLPLELARRLMESGAAVGTAGTAGSYVFTSQADFKWLLFTMMEEAGVRLLLHSLLVDVVAEDPCTRAKLGAGPGALVKGLVVENKAGRQVVLGRCFIDATGDGDVAARSGAPFVVGAGPDDLATRDGTPLGTMQGMGVMFRVGNVDMPRCFEYLKEHQDQFAVQPFALLGLNEACENFMKGEMMTINARVPGHGFQIYNSPIPGVVTLCCPSCEGNGLSARDLTDGEVTVTKDVQRRVLELRENMPGFENAFALDSPDLCVRETRHIHGEYILNIEDVLGRREFEDGIGRGGHPIDIHPIPDELRDRPMLSRWYFNIPYRSLVPKNVDNLLVAGRCISATREASGCTRPTAQCMVTGEAAGAAAALCVADGVAPRALDIAVLRQRLAAQGVVL